MLKIKFILIQIESIISGSLNEKNKLICYIHIDIDIIILYSNKLIKEKSYEHYKTKRNIR